MLLGEQILSTIDTIKKECKLNGQNGRVSADETVPIHPKI